jgi:glutamate/aspartate transport system substrate-binding protein
MKAALTALLGLALLSGPQTAWAEEGQPLSGTLRTIQDRGTILIGYRDSAPPFSFLNKAGQPIGFSQDLCHGIAADVATVLGRDLLEPDAPAWQKGVRIVLVPVKPDERLAKVMSGAIDLECGSTTANAERMKSVAFSPVFFLAGTKLMVREGSGIKSYRDLAGRSVAVSTGTTNAEALHRLAGRVTPPITIVETSDLNAAFDQLASGQVDAFASDDILLSGMLATRTDGNRYRIVGDYLSYEPYAIMSRKDDPDFNDLIRASFERMAAEGILTRLYNRWFLDRLPNGETLGLEMSPQLAEMYRALGQQD